jgi:hypothetical protein
MAVTSRRRDSQYDKESKNMTDNQAARELLKAEYDRVRSEQAQRIGFRDNLLFVQLAATGAIASWVLTNNCQIPKAVYALLLIPWVCVVVGWTYLVNDHHISRSNKYVRKVMNERADLLAQLKRVKVIEDDGAQYDIEEVFGWGAFHRMDKRRKSRKIIQCFVDELTFTMPGFLSILGFLYLKTWEVKGWLIPSMLIVELLCLVALFILIIQYAEFSRTR